MIRVLLAEDQRMMLEALNTLLEFEPDIEVVATALDGEVALKALHTHQPDVLVTDIEMPGISGLDLAAHCRRTLPSCRVIILTTFSHSGYLRRALELGVAGYLLKDASPAELANAIQRVHQGGRWIDPELAVKAWGDPDPLTERQRAVLRLVEIGWSNAEIAKHLKLSEGTVRNYLHEAMGKLQAKNRTEAARLARANGWL